MDYQEKLGLANEKQSAVVKISNRIDRTQKRIAQATADVPVLEQWAESLGQQEGTPKCVVKALTTHAKTLGVAAAKNKELVSALQEERTTLKCELDDLLNGGSVATE